MGPEDKKLTKDTTDARPEAILMLLFSTILFVFCMKMMDDFFSKRLITNLDEEN